MSEMSWLEFAKKQREELRVEWIKSGCEVPFYTWLVDRGDKALKQN